jgi:hypothetical protein
MMRELWETARERDEGLAAVGEEALRPDSDSCFFSVGELVFMIDH